VLDAVAIFVRAQQAWAARAVPAYESFQIACDRTFLAARCRPGDVVAFTVRSSDGRTFAATVPKDGGSGRVLLRGGFITGPAGAPFGFARVVTDSTPPPSPPPNFAADPLRTIAVVTASSRVYDVTLAGDEILGGRRCYHLELRPRRDPDRFPLRDLWINETSFEIVQLTYARPYEERDTWAAVEYRFAPVGPHQIWAIVHIEAEAVTHGLLSTKVERIADDLSEIAFPAAVPSWYFEPGAPSEPANEPSDVTPPPKKGY
jgi:hypothetical protein